MAYIRVGILGQVWYLIVSIPDLFPLLTLVMSAYKEINCLISRPKHYVVCTQKNRRNETVLLSTKIVG